MRGHLLCRVTQYLCFISRCTVIARITLQRNQNLIWRPIIAFSRGHSNGCSSLIFVQYFLKIGKWGHDLGKALPALYLRVMKQCISLEDSSTLKFLLELQLNMMSRVYLWCSHTHKKISLPIQKRGHFETSMHDVLPSARPTPLTLIRKNRW